MAENNDSAQWWIDPAGFILTGFCFIIIVMLGKIGDILVYQGQIQVSTVGILAVLMFLAMMGFLINSAGRGRP